MAHLPQVLAIIGGVLGFLSALSKGFEALANVLTGKPQIVISEVDSYLVKGIGLLQSAVDWLAPRTATPNPPASTNQASPAA